MTTELRESRITGTVAVAAAAYAFAITMVGTTLPTPLYSLYQRKFGFSELMITVIFAVYAAGVIASIEAAEAIKLLVEEKDRTQSIETRLVSFDVWSGQHHSVRVARDPECRVCVHRKFRYLEGTAQPHVTMCGRDSVQIHERNRHLDLALTAQRLSAVASDVRHNDFLLRFRVPPHEIVVFTDGRAIIKGTRDAAIARSLYARYLGA